jgi:hypothetical protein
VLRFLKWWCEVYGLAAFILVLAMFACQNGHGQGVATTSGQLRDARGAGAAGESHKPAHVADRSYWTAEAAATAAELADLETTRRGLARGCIETSPLYGQRPSTARLYAQGLGIAAAATVGEYFAKRWLHGHPAWLIFPAMRATGHGFAAAANAAQVCR